MLEVYVPTCAGWSIDSLVVDGSSPEGRGFRWQLQRINGQGTKQFILGEVPIGYKVVEKRDQDVSADYEAPEFPLDYSYEIGVSQAPFQEVPDFEGDRPRARFRTESSAFDGTDAKPGVWEDDLGFTESLDELDEYMQRNCPAS
jgi:hypothetical protein